MDKPTTTVMDSLRLWDLGDTKPDPVAACICPENTGGESERIQDTVILRENPSAVA